MTTAVGGVGVVFGGSNRASAGQKRFDWNSNSHPATTTNINRKMSFMPNLDSSLLICLSPLVKSLTY